jgi:predicted deacylase
MTQLPQVQTLAGNEPGPTLALLGAVHGNELVGVLAINTLASTLESAGFRGTVRWAAPALPAAWEANSRTSPVDGLNLARTFPGDPLGSPTQQVAAHLSASLIAGADLLIDLHTGSADSDMPLLCGYQSSGPLAAAAAAAARAFSAPLTWLHPVTPGGRSLSAAAAMHIPSLYVETAGMNQVREADLQFYRDGVLRVMAHLGMIDDAPAGPSILLVEGDGNTDEGLVSPAAGFFVTATDVGQRIRSGDLIGRVVEQSGRTTHELRSEVDGVVMLLRRHARIQVGDTLAIVARATSGAG